MSPNFIPTCVGVFMAAAVAAVLIVDSGKSHTPAPIAKTAIQQEAEAREAEQRAKDKDSNMQTGCSLLTMATAGSLSQIASPTSCPSLKTSMGDANTCVVAALMTYNQNRGFAQLDRPPLHVRKQVAKACIMLIYGDSENRAEYLADKATIRD